MPTKDKVQSIRSWSFSRLLDFEACPYLAKLKLIDKIPEPERPLPPGKTEHANDRGSRIHLACEHFVQGIGEFPVEMKEFEAELKSLRDLFKKGKVTLEGEWGFDKDWTPTDWKIAWLRMKLDACVQISKEHVAVIDFKTGRRFGNEIKHGEQVQLYALAVFLRMPTVEHVTVELWYPDVKDLAPLDIVRPLGMRALKMFDKRGRRMTDCTEFKPNPNIHSCKYCPYHPVRGSGHCTFGV